MGRGVAPPSDEIDGSASGVVVELASDFLVVDGGAWVSSRSGVGVS
jgi:hypothetical protein